MFIKSVPAGYHISWTGSKIEGRVFRPGVALAKMRLALEIAALMTLKKITLRRVR